MSINNKRSYTEYTVTQPTTDFAIGFDDYDEGSKDIILVTLNGVLVETLGYAAMRKNESTVTITPAITEGTVRLTRETDIDEPFHKFTAGALFSAKSMDENFQQVRHSQQEVRDGFEYLASNTSGIVSSTKAATNRANDAADVVEGLITVVNDRVSDVEVSQVATIRRVDNFIDTDVVPIVNDAISNTVISSGFVTIDSFELGATLTQRNQALRHTVDGKLYRWAGDLPKVVPVSSTPASTGGFGNNAWLEVSDTILRQELKSQAGFSLVKNVDGTVDSLDVIKSATWVVEGMVLKTRQYSDTNKGWGGNTYRISATPVGSVDGGSCIQLPTSGLYAVTDFPDGIHAAHFGDLSEPMVLQTALDYATSRNEDITVAWHIYLVCPTTIYLGPESGSCTSTVYWDAELRPTSDFNRDASGLVIRYMQGRLVGNILYNGFGRCLNAIEFHSCNRLTIDADVHGRNGKMWGVLFTAVGSNNTMIFSKELRGTFSGSNLPFNFTFNSDDRTSTIINTTGLNGYSGFLDYLVEINGKYYYILASSATTAEIVPSMPIEDIEHGVGKVYIGGGIGYVGKDTGVHSISKMVTQSNKGVGVKCASMYGQTIMSFVGELNQGPSILLGASPTAVNKKNTFLDCYFEQGPTARVVVMSSNSELNMLNHFNLGRLGVFARYGANVLVSKPKFLNGDVDGKSNASKSVSINSGQHLVFRSFSINVAIEVTLFNYEYAKEKCSLYVINGNPSGVLVKDADGQLINKLNVLQINNTGDFIVEFTPLNSGWAASVQTVEFPVTSGEAF